MKPSSLRMAAVASMAALSLRLTPMLPASASVGDTVPVEETDDPIVVTAPYPPERVVARAAPGKASVTRDPPADDGGSSVTEFLVDYSLDLEKTWAPASPVAVAGPETSFTVTELTNEAEYRFRVAALNSVGRGSWS